jgi:hypothetical protein
LLANIFLSHRERLSLRRLPSGRPNLTPFHLNHQNRRSRRSRCAVPACEQD